VWAGSWFHRLSLRRVWWRGSTEATPVESGRLGDVYILGRIARSVSQRLLLALLLLRPVLAFTVEGSIRRVLVMLVDGSASMQIADPRLDARRPETRGDCEREFSIPRVN
jgi:hypothetical protein